MACSSWIECCSGAYQDRIGRCRILRDAFGLDADRAVVVLSDASTDTCADMSAIHCLRVVRADEMEGMLTDAFPPRAESSIEPHAVARRDGDLTHTALDTDPKRLVAMLRGVNLRPHPGVRPTVLHALVELLGEHRPRSARELRGAISERTGVSRGKVGELLRALSFGGALVDTAGQPLSGLVEPIGGLVSHDVATLEALCERAWRANLAAQDPTLLASASGERAFRAAIRTV